MSILHQALNVNNDQELETLVETLDLSDSQYIHFMTALNEDMSVDGLRYILENLTKSFDNGSYEKLVEQFKKKPCTRKMKKVEEDTVYDHSWYEVKGGKYPKRTKEGVIIKEDVAKINPKVLDELYDIISENYGDEWLSDYDEVEFMDIEDAVYDFGNDIDGYDDSLRHRYALGLKELWKQKHKITESKEEVEEPISEEPVEEKPVSTADPELAKFIDQTEKVADNTMNPEILKGLSDSIASKIPLATDVEQMNKLGELKTKIDTKLNAASKAPVVEGYEYNPDDEEWFDIGDKVEFKWNVEGKGEVKIEGTVREVQTIGGNRYYNISSYNPETKRVENYYRVDPVGEEMKRIYDEDLDETCSSGCCSAGSVATIGKRLGKKPKKKKIPEAIDTKLFKESIFTDTPAESILEGHTFKYFMNEGRWYLSCDNALVKTFDKITMLESIDEIINGEEPSCGLLEGYSCYEMNLLMEGDITASNSTGNGFNDDNQLKAAIIASAEKNNKAPITDEEKNKLEQSADNPEIQKQNKDSADKLNLKVGQDVNIVNPETSELEKKQLTGVDKEKGLAFLKNKMGEIDIEPASKVQ